MTLTEYVNQKKPEFMPNVQLAENEINTHSSITIYKDTLTLVTVKGFEQFEYILKNGSGPLFSTDTHGNPTKLSCFSYNPITTPV